MSLAPHKAIALTGLVVVAGVALGSSGLLDPSPGGERGAPTASVVGDGPASSPGAAHAPTTSPTGAAGANRSGGAHGGVEVLPETTSTPSTLPGLERGTEDSPIFRTAPARTAQASGRLVAGYPAAVLGPAPRSRVVSSSVSPSGNRVQLALVAHRSGNPDAVLRYYRIRLGDRGFVEVPTSAVGGATAAAFQRDDGSVVVTSGGRPGSYSVFATVLVRRG
jgi:hypothetical protein